MTFGHETKRGEEKTMKRRQATEEQKQAAKEKREHFRELWKTVRAMTPEAREAMASKYGIVTCEGHVLSGHNTCMVAAQSEGREAPSVVGGFQQWRRQGRMVCKGEHGYMIWVPTMRKDAEAENLNAAADAGELSFIVGYVFDVTQTEEIAAMAEAA